MADVASLAGVAKATLYNHFRTKHDLYAAAVDAEVRSLGDECVGVARDEGLAAALVRAADHLGTHPAARRIATDEPAVLARLTMIGSFGAWRTARDHIAQVLRTAGASAGTADVELVLRWAASYLGAPGAADQTAAAADRLAAALRVSPPA
jgi:AcrR family transcriptional regulator